MTPKFIKAFMDTAKIFADLSYAKRLKVGAIIVKDNRIISIGYNGTPAGWDNDCEYKDHMDRDAGPWLDPEYIEKTWPFITYSDMDGQPIGRYRLKTKPEVLHAERNAIDKLAKSTESGENASMFITHSPCLECSKSIYGAGIKEVYYATEYRSPDGVEFLRMCGIQVKQI